MTTPARDEQRSDVGLTDEAPSSRSAALLALLALIVYALLATTLLQSALFGDDVVSPGAFFAQNGPFTPALRTEVQPGLSLLSDRVAQFMPWMRYAADNYAADGHLPLWKSLALCGAPLVGNGQSAMFFPPNLLAILLGAPPWVNAMQSLIKLVGGAFFAYLLARHLKLSYLAALLAGLIFGFGGFCVLFLQHPHTNVSMLLPLLLLAADRVVLQPTRGRVALLALVAGLQHLGGHAETAAHCQLAAAALGVARAWSLRREATPVAAPVAAPVATPAATPAATLVRRLLAQRLLALAAGLVLGALLGAIQILPQLEYIAESDSLVLRAWGKEVAAPLPLLPRVGFVAALALALLCVRQLAKGRRLLWLAAPALVAAVYFGLSAGVHGGLSPQFIAPLAADWFGTVHDYFGESNYVELNGAFAGAALSLALLGLLAGRPRGAVRAAGVLLGLGLLGLYTAPGLNELLGLLPMVKLAVNTRLSLLALLATALLAGFGLDAIGRAAQASGAAAAATATAAPVRRLGIRYAVILIALLAGSYGALAASVRSGEFLGKTVPDGWPSVSATPMPIAQISQRLPKPLVARLADTAMPFNEPYKVFAGSFKAPGPVAGALLMYGPANRAVGALCTPATSGGEGSQPLHTAEGEPVYLFVGAVPAKAFPAGPSTVRLRLSLADGRTLFSNDLRSPDDPGTTAWPFPAQPAPGRAKVQLVLLLLAGVLCASLLHAQGGTRDAARLALVALVAASLLPFTTGMLPLLEKGAFYPRSGALDRLARLGPNARMIAMVHSDFQAEIPTWYGIRDVRGYDALHPRRVARLLRQATDDEPWTWPMELTPKRQDPDLRLLGVMAVGCLAGWNEAPTHLPLLHYEGEALMPQWAPFRLVSNPEFLPRARLVSGAVIEADDERALAAMVAADFPHATTVVLASGAPFAAAAPAESAESAGSALIVQDRPDVVRVAVEPRRPCQLVLADTFFPGWKALVDGRPREIVRANLAFRAVAVAPGEQMVEFRYEPLWFRVGAALSAVGALLLLGLCVRPRRAASVASASTQR